uniref:Uncharacterized protein n=1 Tax=Arundo donax TaxID=35708 RepID=A0A0A9C7T4_ARUDO
MLGPITWDFLQLTMAFNHQGRSRPAHPLARSILYASLGPSASLHRL